MTRSMTCMGWMVVTLCASAIAADGFVNDVVTGCRVFRPSLQEGEAVAWKGRCAQGYADGAGTAIWSLGGKTTFVYEGTFVRGKLEGMGRMQASGGDRYEGKYKGGKRDGKGVYLYANGTRYEGGYKANSRDGHGTATLVDGTRTAGEWRGGALVDTTSPTQEKAVAPIAAANHELPSWANRAIEEAGLLEWLTFWGFLLLTPVYFLADGISQLRTSAKRAHARRPSTGASAARKLVVGLVLLACTLLILLFFGRLLIALTIKGVGGWVVGFVWSAFVCLVALPLCLVGAQLRLSRDYRKPGYPASAARKAGMRAALGVGAIVVIGLGLLMVDDRLALGFCVAALIAGVVGWFGGILVPESVAEVLE